MTDLVNVQETRDAGYDPAGSAGTLDVAQFGRSCIGKLVRRCLTELKMSNVYNFIYLSLADFETQLSELDTAVSVAKTWAERKLSFRRLSPAFQLQLQLQ